jgi:cytochrome P450
MIRSDIGRTVQRGARRPPWPGLRGHWLWGCLPELRRDPLGLFVHANREHGHCVRIRTFPGQCFHLLTHPEAIEHVLHRGPSNDTGSARVSPSRHFLGGTRAPGWSDNLALLQRRLLARLTQPAFHSRLLARLATPTVRAAEGFVRRREEAGRGQVFDIFDEMRKLTLRIAGVMLFSRDIGAVADEVGAALRVGFVHVRRRSPFPPLVPGWLPTPANLASRRARRALRRVVSALIRSRRRSAARPDDLLSLLLAAQEDDLLPLLLSTQDVETGAGRDDEQLANEVLTLLTAGHDALGAALAWTWYLLGFDARVQNDLADEVRGVLGGRSPTRQDLPRMPLLGAVLAEALRLYPPVWAQFREGVGPDEVDGLPLPAGSVIALSQYVTHRHPDFWVEPEKFDPCRFLPGQAERWHRFAYFPFGGGPHACLGEALAQMVGPLVLATVLQRCRVLLVPGQQVLPDATFTLRPKDGVKVALWPR